MAKLFLLKPGFTDKTLNKNTLYYCPQSAHILGVLNYYPQLKDELEVIYIDFERPRKGLVELVGEENQGCPNLVIPKSEVKPGDDLSYFSTHGDHYFVDSEALINRYFTEKYKIGVPH
ncbi:MAG: DUF3088 family protein [Draconibacterium sp.]